MKYILIILNLIFLPLFADIDNTKPETSNQSLIQVFAYPNHTIVNYTIMNTPTYRTYVQLDDGSYWLLNPNRWQEIQQSYDLDELLNYPISIMPDVSDSDYPVKIIVHHSRAWIDLEAAFIQAPDDLSMTRVLLLREGEDMQMFIGEVGNKDSTKDRQVQIRINPLDSETAKRWKPGQRVIEDGVWFMQYDSKYRINYNCDYLYSLYNYDTNEFVFYSFIQ